MKIICASCSFHFLFESSFEVERRVGIADTLEEFVLELDPVESEGVQEALECIHHHEHSPGHCHVGEPQNERYDHNRKHRGVWPIATRPSLLKKLCKEGLSEL